MEQLKVENVKENPNGNSSDSTWAAKHENVTVEEEAKSCERTQSAETASGDILVDSLKIEPVVTEITTETIPVAIESEVTPLQGLGKDGDATNEASFEDTDHSLEVICIEQPVSSGIDTRVVGLNQSADGSMNEKAVPSREVKHEEACSLGESSLSTDAGCPEEDENCARANVLSEETCDPNTMSVVEEIVTTSKSAYSVEIQEQGSADGRQSFVTKDLVTLEVVSENEEAIKIVEENVRELKIEREHDCDSSVEKLPSEILLAQVDDVEDNGKNSAEREVKREVAGIANDGTKSSAVADNRIKNVTILKKDSQEVDEMSSVKTTTNHRSVIQEIVDDWIDDNNDDVSEAKNSVSDSHDSVEIELTTLLAEDRPNSKDEKVIKDGNKSTIKSVGQGKVGAILRKSRNNAEFAAIQRINGLETKSKASKSEITLGKNFESKEMVEVSTYILPHITDTLDTIPIQDTATCKQKAQPSRAGLKVSSRHLMSQIASTAEVTEVLKERIKQKQKEIELPQGGDILFVKKITQRLSSKLSAASSHGFAGKKSSPQPLNSSSENYSNNSVEDNAVLDDAEKIETADNRELLAILEGDVDPDWSNLKPHTISEPSKSSEMAPDSNVMVKLDPLMERELALKQLLELPTISVKKNSVKKRRTFKPAPSKVSSNIDQTVSNHDGAQVVVSAVDTEEVQTLSATEEEEPPSKIEAVVKVDETNIGSDDTHMEESRSGRKRKPTEKAREHEQNSTKKQKVYKGKISEPKKSHKMQALADDSCQELSEVEEPPKANEPILANPKPTSRNILSKIGQTRNRMYQSKPAKMGTKLAQNIAKRNMPVKKLLRHKPSTNVVNPKTVHMKSKFTNSPKKYKNTMKQKVQKRLIEVSSSEIKPKKKSNEIDKLLQDEGVVNLLYDVEQPERKRLVPITKSQTKVMDLHKVQRELKIRTKLVRNAVLRLRTSGGSPTKITSRSKRTVTHVNVSENESRENERMKSTRSTIFQATDFMLPAKIRNAADASVIVRRHSSSSFSSTSGSPRASIDGPDRQMEPSGSEEGPAHVTRSARRRHSQNEKNKQFAEVVSTPKKNELNRKKSTESADNNSVVPTEKGSVATRPSLRTDAKSVEKTMKNENIDAGKSSSNGCGSKITTRSNGTPVEKEIIKTKKGTKTKAALSKAKDVVETEMEIVEEDKLSACLAEAASALSNADGAANQSGSTTVNRKLRVPSIAPKMGEKLPPDVLDQFSNKEINLKRHGNIVQLILTPSSTKWKNGLTLQIMHELRDALMLLRRDEGCRVVLLTSTGTSFCEGLDLSNLIHDNKEERRVHAEEMANGVKEFIKTLANFNKPIVAGIQGAAIGLGVTMLPLFDLVIASDKATFSTPYGQLGQIPEGAAILTLSQTIGNTITSELLLGGRTLTASEALRAGLVTRVLWPDRFQGELIPSLQAMSEHSSQSMEATKTLLRHSLRKKLDASLESESYLLIQHWCSAECQTLIKNYIDGKGH